MDGVSFLFFEASEDDYSHTIEAHRGADYLGFIALNPDDFNVDMIKVEIPFRRQGVATLLFAEARRRYPQLSTRKRTPDGDAFFEALGITR